MVAGLNSTVFINEIHYDNNDLSEPTGTTDANEYIEIANSDSTHLTGWTVVLYNGSNGTNYNTINLS